MDRELVDRGPTPFDFRVGKPGGLVDDEARRQVAVLLAVALHRRGDELSRVLGRQVRLSVIL